MHLVAGTADANWFIAGGRFAAETIQAALHRQGLDLGAFSSVLDFGCGCGRVIPHLRPCLRLNALYGCDYNSKLIRWCQQNLSFARFSVNRLAQPLSYPDSQFDLTYGFSVLTHLTRVQQELWLAEFARVLRPGGVLILSTHGDSYLEKLSPEQKKQYQANEIVVMLPSERGRNECAAFHPPAAFRDLADPYFATADFVPEGAKGNPSQDLWVLIKR